MKKSRFYAISLFLAALIFLLCMSTPSLALITGSHGNRPIENIGLPLGTENC